MFLVGRENSMSCSFDEWLWISTCVFINSNVVKVWNNVLFDMNYITSTQFGKEKLLQAKDMASRIWVMWYIMWLHLESTFTTWYNLCTDTLYIYKNRILEGVSSVEIWFKGFRAKVWRKTLAKVEETILIQEYVNRLIWIGVRWDYLSVCV